MAREKKDENNNKSYNNPPDNHNNNRNNTFPPIIEINTGHTQNNNRISIRIDDNADRNVNSINQNSNINIEVNPRESGLVHSNYIIIY